MKSYSQHGEDKFINDFLSSNCLEIPKVFLDIGAYDGEIMSNSKMFEDYGWKRILVDANEEAITKANGLYEFVVAEENVYGHFHFDKDKWGLAYVETTKKSTGKKCITLSELCRREALTEIGILSLDIEGEEVGVLRELLNHSSIRPYIICVEGNTLLAKTMLRVELEHDYYEIGELNVNLIFARKDIWNKFKPKSKLVTYKDWGNDYFLFWANRLGIPVPVPPQRKYWEFIEIANILLKKTDLKGKKGIGFGVGEEPMASGLASMGAEILATDIGSNHSSSKDWDNGQLAKDLESLYKPEIIQRSVFEKLVKFEELDMNEIPSRTDLFGKFDFSFSCGSIEHIGGIDKTIKFLVDQMKVLKPGGIAVHTTEFNLSSNDETLDAHNICILRKKDIDQLRDMLDQEGYTLSEVDFSTGDSEKDRFVDTQPFTFSPHLKLTNGGFTHTSILLIIQRKDES